MKLFSFFSRKRKKFLYKCSCCGKIYEELPLCFGSEFPDYYFEVPPDQREQRIKLRESLCVVDEEHFFHRGRITIPIIDHPEDLIFNVWTSISKENFIIRNEQWNNPDRIDHDPYFGWLQTVIPTYGETINIKILAYEQEVGLIPSIKVIEEGHSLTVDQQNGITLQVATEKVDLILKEFHRTADSKN